MKRTSAKVRVMPTRPAVDPAGLDQLLVAAGRGVARYIEGMAASRGVHLEIWDGKDGLGSVLAEAIEEVGVPNQRFAQLVTPRAIAERAGVVRKRAKQRRVR